MARQNKFLYQLESYFLKRLAGVKVAYAPLVVALFVGVVLTSAFYRSSSENLRAGGGESLDALIRAAAKKGDYVLSQKLYEQRDVLGYSTNSSLEEIVYPDRYINSLIKSYEKKLTTAPYWYDGHFALRELYLRIGNVEEAEEHGRILRWLNP